MAKAADEATAVAGQKEPDWMVAKRGMCLLINNNVQEAHELFSKNPDSLQIYGGHCIATFMDALMSFEEEKLNVATNMLKELERRCSTDSGWLKSVKKAFSQTDVETSLELNLESQIMLADSQMCMAVLTFLQQDFSGFFKGGWVLRKAWKAYQNIYRDILQLYKQIVGEVDPQLPEIPTPSPSSTSCVSANGYIPSKIPYSHSAILSSQPTDTASSGASSPNSMKNNCSRSSIDTSTLSFLKKSFSVNSALSKHTRKNSWSSFTSSLSLAYITSTLNLFSSSSVEKKPPEIDKETVKRLLGAVSLGYGLFQLGVSLLPNSLLKVTNFLGFGGDRKIGVDCLMYARNGVDMRAPLATLSLLWYHTIVRPFYALDGTNVQAGVNAAMRLIEESEAEYSNSALFLFFKGRCCRLNSDIPTALHNFKLSVDNAAQREVKILAMHEVGWCHLNQLDFCAAETSFTLLKTWSRWSKSFYSYLSGISCGACGNPNAVVNLRELRTIGAGQRGNHQLDEFLLRRSKCFPASDKDLEALPGVFFRLLAYEVLYIWNALPSCTPQNIEVIKKDCEAGDKGKGAEPMVGLSLLILGVCYCIEKQFAEAALKFRKCLERRKDLPYNASDAHISAFTQYELSSLLLKSDETKAEGKQLLQNISQYKDYDFEQRLALRVHAILRRL